jgi:hypothetical protein
MCLAAPALDVKTASLFNEDVSGSQQFLSLPGFDIQEHEMAVYLSYYRGV